VESACGVVYPNIVVVMEPPSQPAMRHGSAPRVMASSSSVVQQARLMESAGTAWHAVKCGNLEVCDIVEGSNSETWLLGKHAACLC